MKEHKNKIFFIQEEKIINSEATLSGSDYNHIINALRYKIGDSFYIQTEKGKYLSTIKKIEKKILTLHLDQFIESIGESKYNIILLQGIPKGNKFDLVIEKSTEMGVSTIQPILTSRTEINEVNKISRLKIDRWRRIAAEASKQSKRSIVPSINEVSTFEESLEKFNSIDAIKIIFWELEKIKFANDVLKSNKKYKDIYILIGPEGGFSHNEVEHAINRGFIPCSLGRYILRSETAGFFSVGLINYLLMENNK